MAGRGTDIKLGDGVEELGGLAVIGTERHESRRIDDQLRGRSGRQGDRGDSRFYLSLQDELMVRFGSERLQKMMNRLGMDDSTPIESKMVSRAVESAQKRVEGNNFDARKRILEYDEVLRKQREIIYNERNEIMIVKKVLKSLTRCYVLHCNVRLIILLMKKTIILTTCHLSITLMMCSCKKEIFKIQKLKVKIQKIFLKLYGLKLKSICTATRNIRRPNE